MADHDSHDTQAAPSQADPPRPRGEEENEASPPGTRTMALLRWLLVALMAVIAAVSVAYSAGVLDSESAQASSGRYHCPMHPQIVQDGPGECPICSMSLVPLAAPAESPGHEGHRHDARDRFVCPMHPEETGTSADARCPICGMKLERRATPPAERTSPAPPPAPSTVSPTGTADTDSHELRSVPGLVPIELSLERVQLIGMQTAAATQATLVSELRTVGYVTPDEARLARVQTRFAGWIERLAVATTGERVRRGQLLASLFSPELLPAQQEFLTARRWAQARSGAEINGAPPGAGTELEQAARTRLELLGMSAEQIAEVAATGKPARTIEVTAPITGTVLSKNAIAGVFVEPGTQLYEIADLSKIWVLADIYENEIGRIAIGQSAEVELEAYPGQSFSGKVSFIYPTLDAETRTLRARIELEGGGGQLRPGMYGSVRVQLPGAQGVVIPREALIDTGQHQYVFVVREGGRFEPRQVTAGARSGADHVQILSGLAAGEVVVTTGNFLIDSESRLRAAITTTAEPRP